MQIEVPEEIYTSSEICRLLKINKATLYKLLHAGDLKGIDVGKGEKRSRWRVTASALKAFMEGKHG